MTSTLAAHYERRRAHLRDGYPGYYDEHLKRIFAVFIILTGIYMIIKTLPKSASKEPPATADGRGRCRSSATTEESGNHSNQHES